MFLDLSSQFDHSAPQQSEVDNREGDIEQEERQKEITTPKIMMCICIVESAIKKSVGKKYS